MKPSERKQKLVEELTSLYKKLDVVRLYGFPNQKDTQKWIADMRAALKNLNEGDYREFVRLSKTVGLSGVREERKSAAKEINQFLSGKVAEWEQYDFSDLDRKDNINKDKKFEYWNLVNPFWLLWKLLLFVWRHKVITVVITLAGLLGIDYSLAWRNTLFVFNTFSGFFLK